MRHTCLINKQFTEVASQLIQTAQSRHLAILDALRTMSLTTIALAKNQTWPFVTLDGFAMWTNRFAIGASAISLVVLAEDYQRTAWAEYSEENARVWMEDRDPLQTMVPYVWKMYQDEYNNTHALVDSDDVAAVSWQSTPANPRDVNFNQLSDPDFAPAVERLLEARLPTQYAPHDYPSMTTLLQPILLADNTLVGYLLAQITWSTYFRDIDYVLDEDSVGVGVMVKSTCESQLVVELDLYYGRVATILNEDQHMAKLDESDLAIEAPLNPNADSESACGTYLQIYGTPQFRANAALPPPKLAIASAMFVTLLSAWLFLLYDWFARRRQAKLAISAKKSLAIVNALFPSTVRDRLLGKDDGDNYFNEAGKPATFGRLATVFPNFADVSDKEKLAIPQATYPSTSGSSLKNSQNAALAARVSSKPIADLFPQVTVLFADIAGFTAWSSVRDPSQVFVLLESIFESLDAIAKRLGVFKVSYPQPGQNLLTQQ